MLAHIYILAQQSNIRRNNRTFRGLIKQLPALYVGDLYSTRNLFMWGDSLCHMQHACFRCRSGLQIGIFSSSPQVQSGYSQHYSHVCWGEFIQSLNTISDMVKYATGDIGWNSQTGSLRVVSMVSRSSWGKQLIIIYSSVALKTITATQYPRFYRFASEVHAYKRPWLA